LGAVALYRRTIERRVMAVDSAKKPTPAAKRLN